jgi:dUTPase
MQIGDDHGLGAGVCEEAPDDPMVEDAYMHIERTLLAQNACCSEERVGYFTHGYDFEGVADCHASIYGNLTSRRGPYSENEKEGAVPTEFAQARRMGHLRVESMISGACAPTKTESQRAGLTLRSMEQVQIQQGHSVVVTTGLRLLSFRGKRARIAQSTLGPGNREKIRIHTILRTHEDRGDEIVLKVTNFGQIPYMILKGSCIGQIAIIGVGDVVCVITNEKHAEICLTAPDCGWNAIDPIDDVIIPGH